MAKTLAVYEDLRCDNLSVNKIAYRTPQTTENICGTIKVHRTTTQEGSVEDAWTDCTDFSVIDDETQGDVAELNSDKKTIKILQSGIFQFGGCLHCQNNTAGLLSGITVLSRILQNGDTELRCSQRGYVINIAAGGEDVLSFNGTALLSVDDTLKLQYYTSNDALDFSSNAAFDSQVAYTLWLIRCGEKI